MNKVWNSAEREYIRKHAGSVKDKDLATKLSEMTGRKVSLQAVRKQRQKMGISKNPGRGKCQVVGQEEEGTIVLPTTIEVGDVPETGSEDVTVTTEGTAYVSRKPGPKAYFGDN